MYQTNHTLPALYPNAPKTKESPSSNRLYDLEINAQLASPLFLGGSQGVEYFEQNSESFIRTKILNTPYGVEL